MYVHFFYVTWLSKEPKKDHASIQYGYNMPTVGDKTQM